MKKHDFSVFSQFFQISKSVKIEVSSQNYFEKILQAQILTLSKSERCLTNLFFCTIIFKIIHSAGSPTSENNLWTIFSIKPRLLMISSCSQDHENTKLLWLNGINHHGWVYDTNSDPWQIFFLDGHWPLLDTKFSKSETQHRIWPLTNFLLREAFPHFPPKFLRLQKVAENLTPDIFLYSIK